MIAKVFMSQDDFVKFMKDHLDKMKVETE